MKKPFYMKPLDLLFPEKCAYCGEIIRNGSICNDCDDKLSDFAMNSKTQNGVYFVYRYDYNYVTEIVMSLKRTGDKKLAGFMADKLCALIQDSIPDASEYTFTFVPRKLSNKLEYGVDQSEILAKLCAAKIGANFTPLLKRKHFTLEQKNLSHDERINNVKGIFKAVKMSSYAFPRKIILIDDVTTTGSTIMQASLALENSHKELGVHVEKVTFSATDD